MKKTTAINSLVVLLLLTPSFLFAQAGQVSTTGVQQGLNTFGGLITTFNTSIVKALGTLFMSASVVAFFWGIVQYVWGIRDGKLEAIKAGREFMIWALLALFVMFSVYGIIKFFQKMVPGLDSASITIPNVIFQGGGGDTTGNNSVGGTGGGGTAGNNSVGGTGTGGAVGGTVGSGGVGGTGTGGVAINCGSGWHPDSNNTGCVPDTATNLNTGGDCTTDGECSGGNVCKNFICQPPLSGAASGATINCPLGWHPDSNSTRCVPDTNTVLIQ